MIARIALGTVLVAAAAACLGVGAAYASGLHALEALRGGRVGSCRHGKPADHPRAEP